MTTSGWNWAWVATTQDTKKSSNSVDQAGGTVYAYRAASRGQISAVELKAASESTATNLNAQWRLWKTFIRPLLDSLPAGARDARWRSGKGLPTKMDALNYGIQGTTLLVNNDSNATNADGRYWDTSEERPKTITEALEDLWTALSEITEEDTSESSSTELEPLWQAVGHRYKDSSLASLSTSLDYRTNVIESDINQLTNDLYGAEEGFEYNFGVPLLFSVAKNLDYLLKEHNVSGWQADPSTVSHTPLEPAAHDHTYLEIKPVPSGSLTQARTGPYTSLYNDILRLRYEIKAVKGSTTWQNDALNPWDGSASDLQKHINYVGSGTSSATNPHGVDSTDTGCVTVFANIAGFIGMTNYDVAEIPTYSSTTVVSNGDSLEAAIGKLDASIFSDVYWVRSFSNVISPATATDELSITAPVEFYTSTAEDLLTLTQDNSAYDPDVLVIVNNTSGGNPNLGHSIRMTGTNTYHTISSSSILYLGADDSVLIEAAGGPIALVPATEVTIEVEGLVTRTTDLLELINTGTDASMSATGTAILFSQYYFDASSPSVADAGRIVVETEGNWTSTAASQDSCMIFCTSLGGKVEERWQISSTGALSNTGGLGRGYIHIKAGEQDPGNAPIMFTDGAFLSTPVAGAFESAKYTLWTIPCDATMRLSLDGTMFSQTAAVTVSGTTTETTLVGAGRGVTTVPANYIGLEGKSFRITARGLYSTADSNPGTLNLRVCVGGAVKDGGTVAFETGDTALTTSVRSQGWVVQGIITCRTTGGSGTFVGLGGALMNTTSVASEHWDMEAVDPTFTWNTTAAKQIVLSAEFSSATTNQITCHELTIEILD